MWFFTSVEFPSDNQDLWRAAPPAFELEILAPPASLSMEAVVLESLTHTPPIAVAEIEAELEAEAELEVEVVADFEAEAFADAIEDSAPPPFAGPVPLESSVAPKIDASAIYLQTLKDVAIAFGASAVFAETLDSVLGREPMCIDPETGAELVAKGLATTDGASFEPMFDIVRVAAAWQAAFRGDEPDFSVCSSMLDEWSAEVLGRFLGRRELGEKIRRELRSRGIAAFGLLEAA